MSSNNEAFGDEDEIDNDYQRRKEEKQETDANEDDWRDYE